MSASSDFETLWDAKKLALLLGFSGKRPEKGVYAMVDDGRIPPRCIVHISQRHYMFHPDRVKEIINSGGFIRVDENEAMQKGSKR